MGLPRRARGRGSASADSAFRVAVDRFCERILQIRSRLDFRVSSRDWAYILENDGVITKGDLDAAQALIKQMPQGREPTARHLCGGFEALLRWYRATRRQRG